jgi:hypothetical protein
MWYPIRTRVSVKQESQFKYDSCGPDARASKKEIADTTSTAWTTAYHGLVARITDMEIEC